MPLIRYLDLDMSPARRDLVDDAMAKEEQHRRELAQVATNWESVLESPFMED